MTPRIVARVTAIACIAVATAVATSAPAHASTAALAGKEYVALGDSFASGYGLPPYSTTPAPGCGQSADNVPHRVARTYGLQLTDATCAGATIGNVVGTAQQVPGGTVPPQLDALTADTAVVSVMVGGNDAGFVQLAGCVAASPQGPLLQSPSVANCASQLGDLPRLIETSVAPLYDAMFAAIRQKAPNAEIIMLGYPSLAPTDATAPDAGCFSSALGNGAPPLPANTFPFTEVDRAFIAAVSAALDSAQQAAAGRNGARFVSTLAASDAHTPCAGTTDPYLNGVSLTSLSPPAVAEGAMHPNSAGQAFLESQLAAALEAAFPVSPPTAGGEDARQPETGAATSTAATGATTELAATGVDLAALSAPAALIVVLGLAMVVLVRKRTIRQAG